MPTPGFLVVFSHAPLVFLLFCPPFLVQSPGLEIHRVELNFSGCLWAISYRSLVFTVIAHGGLLGAEINKNTGPTPSAPHLVQPSQAGAK